jgi:SAM-dependent methyltransferase
MNSPQARTLQLGLTPEKIARAVAQRYPTVYLRQYAYWKIRTDPVFPAVRAYLSGGRPLPLSDLGCGPGVLEFYLKARGFDPPMHGIDLDPYKIAAANDAARGEAGALRFEVGDIRDTTPLTPGHVLLLDVLLYLDPSEQAAVLRRAAAATAPEGLLIVRSGLRAPRWRFRVSRFADHCAHAIRWMSTAPTHYPSADFLRSTVMEAGLTVRFFDSLWGRTPFCNHLLVARREGSE